jgi:hypothetical protein
VGATYYVVSVSMADQYPWAADSLRRYNMGPPSPSEVGRNPTPRELRTVLLSVCQDFVALSSWCRIRAPVRCLSRPALTPKMQSKCGRSCRRPARARVIGCRLRAQRFPTN